MAAERGHLAVVKYLVPLPRLEASTMNDAAFCVAAEKGYLDIVKLLTNIARASMYAQTFFAAAKFGHLDVINYLTTLSSINLAAQSNLAFLNAVRNGHLDVVQYLTTLPELDPTAQYNEAIRLAWDNNHIKMLVLLALHPLINAENYMAEDLKQTINVIKNYRHAPANYYHFFKASEMIKDVKQYITQLGLTKLKQQLPEQVDTKIVIEALMSFNQRGLIKEEEEFCNIESKSTLFSA